MIVQPLPLSPFDEKLSKRSSFYHHRSRLCSAMPFGQRNKSKQVYTHLYTGSILMRTTTLQSSKATSRLWKLFAAMLLVWILVPIGQASAQGTSSTNNGSRSTLTGVDDLTGVDPSSDYCTEQGSKETDGNKIVCLYNVGAKKFLSIGGKWGTHASLDVTPHPIFMAWDNSTQTYFLESKVKGSANRA